MKIFLRLLHLLIPLLICWTTLPLMATAQLLSRFPAGSIQTAEQAGAALDAVQKEKLSADADYRKHQRACYDQFLVTPCLEEEKARYQQSSTALRSIELEANRYQRQQKAAQTEQRRREAEEEGLRNAPQEALKRQQNQETYLQKQTDAQKSQSSQQQKLETTATKPRPEKLPKTVTNDAAARQKSADKQHEKVKEAAERRAQTAQRRARNEADRARKAQQSLLPSPPSPAQ